VARLGTGSRAARARVAELQSGLDGGSRGLGRLREPARRANDELAAALRELDAMLATSKADPGYQRVYQHVATAAGAVSGRNPLTSQRVDPAYHGLDAELATASGESARAAAGVRQIQAGAARLDRGLTRVRRGSAQLRHGLSRLSGGGERLASGIERIGAGGRRLEGAFAPLSAGARQLDDGTGRLQGGAATLARELGSGASRAGALQNGVDRMHRGVAASSARTARLSRQLAGGGQSTARVFDSGYLTLAGLDAAGGSRRTASTFAVNLDKGGSATRIAVIEDGDPSKAGDPLRQRLERSARRLSQDTGLNTAVGGPASLLQDFDSETSGRLPVLIVALVLVTYLVLVPILRSLLLPALAVALNVATVAAAFGLLTLGFQGNPPALGGAGDLDAISVLAIFGIVFGLSIDYEVFLLARMREGYARTGTTEGAISYGLRRTAGVITGAALIMTGVFAAFAVAPIASMRELGIGLTVAVLLDATVVRLVLLPAIIRLAGRAAWWLPAPIERLLPSEAAAPAPLPYSAG
jgi:putative drug exporter of the RND superfamily